MELRKKGCSVGHPVPAGWDGRGNRAGCGAAEQQHTLHLPQQPLSSAASGRRCRQQKLKSRGWKKK